MQEKITAAFKWIRRMNAMDEQIAFGEELARNEEFVGLANAPINIALKYKAFFMAGLVMGKWSGDHK